MDCALVGPISLVESSDGSGSAARSFRGSLYGSCRTQSWKVDLEFGSGSAASLRIISFFIFVFASYYKNYFIILQYSASRRIMRVQINLLCLV